MKAPYRYTKIALCVIPLAVLGACSSGSDDSTPANTPDPENSDTSDIADTSQVVDNETPPATSSVAEKYIGTYVSACDGNVVAMQTITADTRTQTTTFYDDAECTTPGLSESIVFSLVYPGGTTTTNLGEADHVDETIESLTINGEVTQPADNFPLTSYEIYLLDGINLYLADFAADTPEERTDILRPLAHVRQ